MSGTILLPREIKDLPFFAAEARPFSRKEALEWIAENAYTKDNCVLKRWQLSASYRTLADTWGWSVKRVRTFLEKCQSWGFVRLSMGVIKGTRQLIITYMIQTLRGTADENWASGGTDRARKGHSKGTEKPFVNNDLSGGEGTAGAQQGHTEGTYIYKDSKDSKKEDSCANPNGFGTSGRSSEGTGAGFEEDDIPFGPDIPDEPRAAGAVHDNPGKTETTGAGSSNSASAGDSASGDAEPSPNSARPPSGGYPAEFETFWRSCPKASRRGGKKKPFEVWRKLSPGERIAVMEGCRLWCKRVKDKDPRYIEMVQTWMNQRRWETEEEACEAEAGSRKHREEAWL